MASGLVVAVVSGANGESTAGSAGVGVRASLLHSLTAC